MAEEDLRHLCKDIFKIVNKFPLSFRFPHECRHLFLQMANYVSMDLCSSRTLNKFIDLKIQIHYEHQ